MTEHIKVLASDEFEGRAPATPGGEKTQNYLAEQLKAIGIEPGAPDGTYFQQVPIVESVVDRNFVLSVPGNTYRYYNDVVAFSGVERPRVQVQGEVVFVGHGINAPELKWNDYAGANVKGKWVMIMVNDPPAPADEPTLFGGNALTYYGRWTYKFEEAARQGAAGALLIHTDESATYPWQVVQSSWSGTQYSLPPQPGAPALGIKAWITERRGEGSGQARRPGSRHAARGGRQARLQGRCRSNIRAAATLQQRSARKTSPNVIGVLKGTNAAQARDLSRSHWDHFGTRDAAAGRQAGRRSHLQRRLRQRLGRAPACSRSRKAMAQGAAEAGALDLLRVRHGGGVGAARLELLRRQPAAADGQGRRQHQHRRRQLPGADDATSCMLGADRSTLGPMVEALAQGARPHAGRRSRIPSAATSSARITSRSPRPACRRCRSASRKQFIGPNAAELKKKQEAYNGKDYHQPSDEFDPAWDFSGGVERHARARAARLAHRRAGRDAEVQRGRSVRASRGSRADFMSAELRRDSSSRSTRSRAARERIRAAARVTPLIEVPWPGTPAPDARSAAG